MTESRIFRKGGPKEGQWVFLNTADRFFAKPPAPMWGVMDHFKWCVVAVALMALENHKPQKLVNAYSSACKHGIVFA